MDQMNISTTRMAQLVKQVAKNVAPIVARKKKLIELIATQEERYKQMLEKQVTKYKAELKALTDQQELFEEPVRKLTGGYGTEDLVVSELKETGVDKDGKPVRKTYYSLKYPDTVIPPTDNPSEETTATSAEMQDNHAPETETETQFNESPEEDENPFNNPVAE